MMIKRYFLLPLFLIGLFTANGQTKFEREYRLPLEAVPLSARQYIDTFVFSSKVKWFYEENLLGNSIEAKVKDNRKRYSIEFDTLGNLQDIEIQTKWNQLSVEVRTQIEQELTQKFTKHKIDKIQLQYTGNRDVLFAVIRNRTTTHSYTTKYELVVNAKAKGERKLYEITFNNEGDLEQVSEIIFKNTDNLEY